MRALPALLVLALLAAGCTVEPPQVQGQLPLAGNAPRGNATLPALPNATAGNGTLDAPPEWRQAQWWRYRERSGDGSIDVRDTRVVTADLGPSWRVDTDNVQVAYVDAREDISTVGPIRKADLAGSQGSAPVEFFRWPLAVNRTWSMTLDGQPMTVTVASVQQGAFAGKPATLANLEARAGPRPTVRYTYVAEAGWFGSLQYLNPDGSPAFTLDLEAWGLDYKGSVVRVTAVPRYRDAGANLQPQGSFDVAQGASFLRVQLGVTGDVVDGAVNLLPPDNGAPVTLNVGPCTSNCSVNLNTELNATPGTWRVAAATVVQSQGTTPAHAQLEVVAATVDRIAIG